MTVEAAADALGYRRFGNGPRRRRLGRAPRCDRGGHLPRGSLWWLPCLVDVRAQRSARTGGGVCSHTTSAAAVVARGSPTTGGGRTQGDGSAR